MLPLSGGVDSASTAISVFFMANKIFKTITTIDDDYNSHNKVLK